MRTAGCLMLLCVWPAAAQAPEAPPVEEPDAAAIMAKVAANVEAAEPARRSFVYHQTVRSSLIKTNGKPVRREQREYDALPGEERTQKTLASFSGERYEGRKTVVYTAPDPDTDMDSGMIRGLTEDLVDDKESRDGIPKSLFPLAPADLPFFTFRFAGREDVNGRPAMKIAFEPVEKKACVDMKVIRIEINPGDGPCPTPWTGVIWVDAEDLQPARITTDLGRGIPWGVRFFLGINMKQLGFALTYGRVAPGVWFPVSYGTEFRVDLFWFYKRNVTLGLESKAFRKTDATSAIQFEPAN